VPKPNLEQLGHAVDAKNRIDKARKYRADIVHEARKYILEEGMPIGGVAVERLLKDTSSVPTSVRPTLQSTGTYILIMCALVCHRMHLSNDLAVISTCHAC
jgi:hypothetical protein